MNKQNHPTPSPSSHSPWSFLWPLLVALAQLLSGWRAERNYQTLPEVLPTNRPDPPHGTTWPGVSVIIPARNEEANLPRLLDSLVAQNYPLYEVIVVDDGSTDGTATIVRRYADRGVRLVQSVGPPAGWTGKNHACWLGAGESIHPWLLFVDADTELTPLALRSSQAFALEQNAGAISLFAQQRCESFWERLLLPFAYQQYFVGINGHRVRSQRGPALANGQYFLINRSVYLQAGGHAANAESIIDDVALATRLKESGVTPLPCRGESLVSVRMYTSLRGIVAGFGKNSYLFLRQSPATGMQTAISTSLAASVLPLLYHAWRKRSWGMLLIASLAYLAQIFGLKSWSQRFDIHFRYALLAPFAAVLFLGIALSSTLRVLTRRPLSWKGRSYQTTKNAHPRYVLSPGWIIEMGLAVLFKKPRSIIQDSALAVSLLPAPPCVTGVEYIPREGSFVLVANHYQRLDLWIGWSGSLLINAIARQRDVSMHFVTTDRARIGRFTVPGTRRLIERVAAVWDLALVTPPAVADERTTGKHYALLRLMRLLRRGDGRSVCIALMPEGDEGGTSGLIEAMPGSGRALYALSTRKLPILPAAVWEEDGRLHAHFGAPFSLVPVPPQVKQDAQLIDTWARESTMRQIAALLPSPLRGKFGGEGSVCRSGTQWSRHSERSGGEINGPLG